MSRNLVEPTRLDQTLLLDPLNFSRVLLPGARDRLPSQWQDRLQLLVPDHPAVSKYVRHYMGKGQRTFSEGLERSWAYAGEMMEILAGYGVPRELVYMVFVESRFKKKARSHRGAAGLWQFMPATARAMGLKVNYWVDERLDPVKSTHAAGRYLRQLYRKFGSWPLAIAGYNAGAGAVSKALRKVGKKDFWSLYERKLLTRQTRQYVPKVLAAIHMVRNLDRFGYSRPRYSTARHSVSVGVRKPLTLKQVARWTGSSLARLKDLNASLRLERIPAGKEFHLRLPPSTLPRFYAAYDEYGQHKS